MRHLILGIVVWLAVGAAASAGSPDPQVLAPIQKFIDAFNKGDIAAAATTHAPEVAIIDEVPPHLWQGPKAVNTWAADLDADSKKNGITDQNVTIAAPTREEVSGDRAYVIVPAVYTFKQGGVAMREEAQMTVVLRKGTGGWLIHAWTWTGPKPVAAAKP